MSWSWGARSNVKDFMEHVEKQWDDEDDAQSGSPSKAPAAAEYVAPVASNPTYEEGDGAKLVAAASLRADGVSASPEYAEPASQPPTPQGTLDKGVTLAPAAGAGPPCNDAGLEAVLRAVGVFDTAWPMMHAEEIDDLDTLQSLDKDDLTAVGIPTADVDKIFAHLVDGGSGGDTAPAHAPVAAGAPAPAAPMAKEDKATQKAREKMLAAEEKKQKKEADAAAKAEGKRAKQAEKDAAAAAKKAAKEAAAEAKKASKAK
jgi:hypothetical protein